LAPTGDNRTPEHSQIGPGGGVGNMRPLLGSQAQFPPEALFNHSRNDP
jgi:hypothetical protein